MHTHTRKSRWFGGRYCHAGLADCEGLRVLFSPIDDGKSIGNGKGSSRD